MSDYLVRVAITGIMEHIAPGCWATSITFTKSVIVEQEQRNSIPPSSPTGSVRPGSTGPAASFPASPVTPPCRSASDDTDAAEKFFLSA